MQGIRDLSRYQLVSFFVEHVVCVLLDRAAFMEMKKNFTEASQETQSSTFTKCSPDFSKVFLEASFSDLCVLPERSWKPSGISTYLHCPSAGPV